jgi:hypothetical protein
MAHRIQLRESARALRIEFEGLLDREALRELAAVAAAARGRAAGREVTVVLGTGTEVDGECVEPLRRLEGVAVRPASPFLARWVRGGG